MTKDSWNLLVSGSNWQKDIYELSKELDGLTDTIKGKILSSEDVTEYITDKLVNSGWSWERVVTFLYPTTSREKAEYFRIFNNGEFIMPMVNADWSYALDSIREFLSVKYNW